MSSMKYKLSIAVRMSRYGSLLRMNRHSYYIVTITNELGYCEIIQEFEVLNN